MIKHKNINIKYVIKQPYEHDLSCPINQQDIDFVYEIFDNLSYQEILLNCDYFADSRLVVENSVFFAYLGKHLDGRAYIKDAIIRGAALIFYEIDHQMNSSLNNIDQLIIDNPKIIFLGVKKLSYLLGVFFAIRMQLLQRKLANNDLKIHNYTYINSLVIKPIGVTGTNGKTSVSSWISQIINLMILERENRLDAINYNEFNLHNAGAITIGTNGYGIYPDQLFHQNNTTPNAIDLQKIIYSYYQKIKNQYFQQKELELNTNNSYNFYPCMEVSSHAIDQGRVFGIDFDTAIFTNLTQDHLDYHISMDNYYNAKSKLFFWHSLSNVVINIDDEYGKKLYQSIKQNLYQKTQKLNNHISKTLQIITYAIDDQYDDSLRTNNLDSNIIDHENKIIHIIAKDVAINADGIQFNLCYRQQSPPDNNMHSTLRDNNSYNNCIQALHNTYIQEYPISLSHIFGKFNLYNILAVIGVLIGHHVPIETIIQKLPLLTPIPGRLQFIGRNVIVDYAHTPDAISNTLHTIKDIIKHDSNNYCNNQYKIYTVFGCGGSRDKSKRAIMGKIVSELSDYMIITNDNPRFDNPDDIAHDIASGAINNNYEIILDRKLAIEKAILLAEIIKTNSLHDQQSINPNHSSNFIQQESQNNNIVLIAGKGHESYQEIKNTKHYFSDIDLVKSILSIR